MLGEYFEGDMRFAEGYDITSGVIEIDTDGLKIQFRTQLLAFTETRENIILGALEEISNKTCIHFVHTPTNETMLPLCVVYQIRMLVICWKVYCTDPQFTAWPGSHCIFHGIAAHEMIHALGNFIKYSSAQVDPEGVRNDYGSLMHYGAYSFSQDASKPTIVPKTDVEIGQRNGLSESDVQKLRHITTNTTTLPRSNHHIPPGYPRLRDLSPATGNTITLLQPRTNPTAQGLN
ncbi:Astacin-like metalloendopeptidase [Orchesella cincta]|uniref:Metalloendopeptidase n=1 Tax=Orchesella cincta TaxID=48709 RepID=A0A1D2M8X6_ORCCI|nr:Astacin-like metalloendopeptidase [Orchesella cincta]